MKYCAHSPASAGAKALPIWLALLLLGGCATFSEDGGFSSVESIAKDRLNKDVKWIKSDADADDAQATVKKLLANPLSVEDAVQIALLNNRGLQATYAELGIAEADLVHAGRLSNPRFAYLNVRSSDEIKIERALTFNFMQLITMPLAIRLERRRFEQTQLRVAAEVLQVATQTRKAYFNTISARQTASYMEDVKTTAETSAELARRMARAGNWSKLTQAREQVFYAETTAQLARAKQNAVVRREQLTRLMGLWGEETQFKLPERLPDLPKAPNELKDIESVALKQRLDVQAMKRDIEGLAASLGLTKATRFINVLELGPAEVREGNAAVKRGYEISVELPIFDWGGARVAKAEAIYMQALNQAASVAINARSEVRESYTGYRTAFDLAKHYRDEIVPLRKLISDENLLRYNGMLISVFELLADAREQIVSVNAYIDALRDFWLAEAELQIALTGKSSAGSMTGTAKSPMMTTGAAAGNH